MNELQNNGEDEDGRRRFGGKIRPDDPVGQNQEIKELGTRKPSSPKAASTTPITMKKKSVVYVLRLW